MSKAALPGFRDFYPAEFAERALIFRAWREVARRYAFVEYDGPPLEPLELYTKKSGDEIVGQLYNFTDKGGREISLRPEMTPSLARMVGARANALRKPVRWFSIPQLFRYERQQRGRLREHFQLNVDIIGEADVTADAELLAAAIDIMAELGLGPADVRARVSDRRLLHAILLSLGAAEEQVNAYYGVIDKFERQPRELSHEKMTSLGMSDANVARLFTHLGPTSVQSLRESFPDAAVLEQLDGIARYLGYLDRLGVGEWVVLDLTIVRGLAYYTGIVFELFDAKGELRAICGGGRYDNLLGALGGQDLPALGFGMGDVVLGELLRERGLMTPPSHTAEFWVAAENAERLPEVMEAARALRDAGGSVEYALRSQQLQKQKKAAQSAGAGYFVTLGEGPGSIASIQSLTAASAPSGIESATTIDALCQLLASRTSSESD